MRTYRLLTTALSGALLTGLSTSAFAACIGASPSCQAPIMAHGSSYERLAPVHITNNAPYSHLKTIVYKNTPNVNITRIHSRTPSVSLTDAPSGFVSNGCATSSTKYCRSNSVGINNGFNNTVRRAAPTGHPVGHHAHASTRTVTTTRRVAAHKKLVIPFVPGIAHVPTSIIDRSPVVYQNGQAQAPVMSLIQTTALNHGSPASGNVAHGHVQGTGPHIGAGPVAGHAHGGIMAGGRVHLKHAKPVHMVRKHFTHTRTHAAPHTQTMVRTMTAPVVAPVRFNHTGIRTTGSHSLGSVVSSQYTYQPTGGGDYWEKASGPTMVGGMPATQIVCRRSAPKPAPVTVRVVRPVIGVPTPIPTPVPYPVRVPVCGQNAGSFAPAPFMAPPRPIAPAYPAAPRCGTSNHVRPSLVCNQAPAMGFGPRWTY